MKQGSRSAGVQGIVTWFLRRLKTTKIERASGTRASNSTNIHVINPWHAVGVMCGQQSCRASMAARKVRYLSAEAPPLPLSGCTQPKSCTCKYKHFADRRAGPRRVTDSDLYKNALSRPVPARLTQSDRRRARGRRATDAATGL
jgi:hypothetical protein